MPPLEGKDRREHRVAGRYERRLDLGHGPGRWRCCRRSRPATCGAAMLALLNAAQSPSRRGTEETMLTPGPSSQASSGARAETAGPRERCDDRARDGFGRNGDRAFGAARRRQRAVAEFSEVVLSCDDRDHAGCSRSVQRATRSRPGSISASPSERLITSIPSRTAASMAAMISGEFPFAGFRRWWGWSAPCSCRCRPSARHPTRFGFPCSCRCCRPRFPPRGSHVPRGSTERIGGRSASEASAG